MIFSVKVHERVLLLPWLLFLQPHQDGPAYFPVVAILSLASPVVMDFTPHLRLRSGDDGISRDQSPVSESRVPPQPFSVLMMPRSLLIFKDDAYSGKIFISINFKPALDLRI